MITCIKSC